MEGLPCIHAPRKRSTLLIAQGLCLVLLMGGSLLRVLPAFAASEGQRHALLVGVTQYPNLSRESGNDFSLAGPANDVKLLQDLLTTKFGFAPDRVTTLVGGASEERERPIRANIEREFRRLAAVAGPDDQVVILLAGHGSQQPTQTCELEPDGLDEIFLPEDTGKWNEASKRVENAIPDKELHQWLTDIRKTGAFVWVIVDACHSGDITRGTPAERMRQLDARVLTPSSDLAAAKQQCAEQRPVANAKDRHPFALSSDTPSPAGGIVVITAAQAFEPTPERPLPESDPQASVYGLFSYTLAQVLQQRQSPLTYRELAERVNARYRSQGRLSPTPMLAGDSTDREVLGLQTWPARPTLLLGHKDSEGRVTLKAGSVHGLYPHTVLVVYPPAGEAGAERPIGHVRVTHLEPLTAFVEPVEFGGMAAPATEQLVAGSRCQIAVVDYGKLRLKVAVQVQTESGRDAEVQTFDPKTGPAVIEEALAQLAMQPGNLMERVANPNDAAWYVRLIGPQLYLIPASGWTTAFRLEGSEKHPEIVPPQFTLGNLVDAAKLSTTLQDALTAIARAHNLLRIQGITDDSAGVSNMEEVDVRIELFDQHGQSIAYGAEGRVLREGDRVIIRLTNTGRHHADLTVLLVDGAYRIVAFFPESFENNRIGPGQAVRLRFKVTRPFGPDQLIAIATKAEGAVPVNLAYLAQPGLEALRSGLRGRATTTLLGQLLDNAMYAQGTTRSGGREQINDYAVRLVEWVTRPAQQ